MRQADKVWLIRHACTVTLLVALALVLLKDALSGNAVDWTVSVFGTWKVHVGNSKLLNSQSQPVGYAPTGTPVPSDEHGVDPVDLSEEKGSDPYRSDEHGAEPVLQDDEKHFDPYRSDQSDYEPPANDTSAQAVSDSTVASPSLVPTLSPSATAKAVPIPSPSPGNVTTFFTGSPFLISRPAAIPGPDYARSKNKQWYFRDPFRKKLGPLVFNVGLPKTGTASFAKELIEMQRKREIKGRVAHFKCRHRPLHTHTHTHKSTNSTPLAKGSEKTQVACSFARCCPWLLWKPLRRLAFAE